jgi:hypothetical protein
MQDQAGGYYTEYSFVNTPVTLPASKRFFVSIDLTNLQWTAGVHDTLSIVSNSAGQTTPSAIWEKQSDNNWYQYTTAGSWNLSASLYIHPFLTTQNTVATISTSATTICEGDQIIFDGTGSTYEDTLLWYFPGGNPTLSNSINPTVTYPDAGSYQAILYVVGGGCGLFDSAFVNIVVNPVPALSVTATPSTICSGNTVNLMAAGATTYVWSPPTYLNNPNISAPVSTPTASITYNVQGTGSNGCVSNASVPITVLNTPVASLSMSDTIVCVNGSITFDGSNSVDATAFSWIFTGGSPSTSTSSAPVVTYPAAGTYTATMIVTNSCGNDTIVYSNIGVGCTGVDEREADWSAFYNPDQQQVQVSVPVHGSAATAIVVNSLGQIVYSMNVPAGSGMFMIDMRHIAAGMYTLMISGAETSYHLKFVTE